jgi:hypothetical protein
MTRNRDKQKADDDCMCVPSAVAEFILKPRGLPHPQGDLDAYLKQCEENLLTMLLEAMDPELGILPARTVMVQCLSKPPVVGEADFSLPVLVRAESKTAACHLAASFAHVTHYLMRGKSSHIRMREIGDCTRGNLVVFASSTPKGWLSSRFANVVHLSLPVSHKRPVPDFDEVFGSLEKEFLSATDGLWKFEMKRFVERASQEQWGAITKSIADGLSPPMYGQHPCSKANHPDRTKAVLKDIFEDKEYLQRVSVLLACGQIVLCLPQTHFFEDRGAVTHHAESVVYDSGLTIVLGGDDPITQKELEQCYWIGYVVASFLAGVHGLSNKLAHEVRREVTHLLARALSHEVGNAGESIYNRLKLAKLDATTLKDIEARTNIAAVAARAVVASGDATDHKPVTDQIKQITGHYLNFSDFHLQIQPYNTSDLAAIQLPPAFTLLLNELLRNAYKHTVKDSNQFRHAELEIFQHQNSLNLKVSNQPKDADKVVALRDGITNSKSKRLGRLRELARFLDAKLVLHENDFSINVTAIIPIPTEL